MAYFNQFKPVNLVLFSFYLSIICLISDKVFTQKWWTLGCLEEWDQTKSRCPDWPLSDWLRWSHWCWRRLVQTLLCRAGLCVKLLHPHWLRLRWTVFRVEARAKGTVLLRWSLRLTNLYCDLLPRRSFGLMWGLTVVCVLALCMPCRQTHRIKIKSGLQVFSECDESEKSPLSWSSKIKVFNHLFHVPSSTLSVIFI